MSTLFVGRLRNKGDKLIAAAPEIAAGFQQAGDALRTYEADRQVQNKEKFLNAKLAADIAGGWAYLSQDAKNSLPDILGLDMNRDPITGDVQIDKTFDNLIEEQARNRVMADPELASQYGLIREGIMSKMPHPAELELVKTKIEGNLAGKQYDAAVRARLAEWKENAARVRMGMEHSLALERIYAANSLKGTKDDAFSQIYSGPGGDLIPESEKVSRESAGEDMSSYSPLTNKEAGSAVKLFSARTSRANQESIAKKRDIDLQLASTKLAEVMASDPTYMGTLKRFIEQQKAGDKKGADQTRLELSGLASLAAQDAGVDPDNMNDTLFGPRGILSFFATPDNAESLLAEATRRRSAMQNPNNPTFQPPDPTIGSGNVGGIQFQYRKKGEVPKSNPSMIDNRTSMSTSQTGMSENMPMVGETSVPTTTTIPPWRQLGTSGYRR